MNGSKGLAPIREMLIERCEIEPEPLVKLQRVDGKTLFMIATIVLTGLFLIPQLTELDNVWEQVKTASIPWMIAATLLSFVTYVAATGALLGAIPVGSSSCQRLLHSWRRRSRTASRPRRSADWRRTSATSSEMVSRPR